MLFSYFLMFVGYTVMAFNILVNGASVTDVTIFFFLLLLSIAQLRLSLFFIGYILGIVGITATLYFPDASSGEFLSDIYVSLLVTYILNRFVCRFYVFIYYYTDLQSVVLLY